MAHYIIRRQFCLGVAASMAALSLPNQLRAASVGAPSFSARLAALASVAQSSNLASDVVERLCWTLFDCIGVSRFAAAEHEALPYVDMMAQRQSDRQSGILGTQSAASVESAAAASAFLIHIAEIDDTEFSSQVRASAVAMSATFAAAEAFDVSGQDFLRGAALAYSAQRALARPFGLLQHIGFMPTAIWGPPAVTLGIGAMLKMPKQQVDHALGISALGVAGPFQYYQDQTEDKRLIVARAAQGAIDSIEMARRGYSAAPRMFEGSAGLFNLFGRREMAEAEKNVILAEAAVPYGVMYVQPKYYAASHSIIPTIEGLRRLPRLPHADEIAEVIIRGSPQSAGVGEKINNFEAPLTRVGAALNFSYVIGLFLTKQAILPSDYAVLPDPKAVALARKCRFVSSGQGRDIGIDIRLNNGRILTASALNPSPSEYTPLEPRRRVSKFQDLTNGLMPQANVRRVLDHCLAIPTAASMTEWHRKLRPLLA